MKVYEKIFREMYRHMCLLTGDEIFEQVKISEMFDYPPDEKIDGLIAYGCIDEERGFVFEIFAGASFEGGKMKILPGSYKKKINLRRAEIEDAEIKILPEEYAAAFVDKIQVADDAYKVSDAKEQTRFITTIDSIRHPNFPDDIIVLFSREGLQPEQAWVRCVSAEENLLTGILLHELKQNFGYSVGEKITLVIKNI